MQYYIQALKLEDFDVDVVDNAVDAFVRLADPNLAVDCVVLDMMMAPGKYIENEEHNEGLKTGIFLYRQLIQPNDLDGVILDGPTRSNIPVAVLTNVTDPDTLRLLAKSQQELDPDGALRIWPKMDTSPMSFADQLARWLGTLRSRSS
jgi:CheY-like chemotaxis protein